MSVDATSRFSLGAGSAVAVTSGGALLPGNDISRSTNGGRSKVQMLLVMVNATVSLLAHSEAVLITSDTNITKVRARGRVRSGTGTHTHEKKLVTKATQRSWLRSSDE